MTEKTHTSSRTHTKPGVVNRPLDASVEEVAWRFHPDQERWDTAGFRGWAEMSAWVAAGFGPEDGQPWLYARFGPDEAAQWQNVVTKPDHAFQWRQAGWEPNHVSCFAQGGLVLPTGAPTFSESFDVAEEWRVLAGMDRDGGAQMAVCGLHPVVAARTMLNGDDLEDVARQWNDHGFNPEIRVRWSYAFTDPAVAAPWRTHFAPYLGITSLHEAKKTADWVTFGWSPPEAAAWAKLGFLARDATMWRDYGWEPKPAAREWTRGIHPYPAGTS